MTDHTMNSIILGGIGFLLVVWTAWVAIYHYLPHYCPKCGGRGRFYYNALWGITFMMCRNEHRDGVQYTFRLRKPARFRRKPAA